jgi:hypothetical protein
MKLAVSGVVWCSGVTLDVHGGCEGDETDSDDGPPSTRAERRRAAFEAAAAAWTGQATGDPRIVEELDEEDFVYEEDEDGLVDEDVWDPADEALPYGAGEEHEDGDLDDVGYALFIANLEAQLLRELQNPGELSAFARGSRGMSLTNSFCRTWCRRPWSPARCDIQD